MLQNIKILEGVTLLSKEEQKNVNGGLRNCVQVLDGPRGYIYDTGTTGGSTAGQQVVVGEWCTFSCQTTLLGITVGSTTTIGTNCV